MPPSGTLMLVGVTTRLGADPPQTVPLSAKLVGSALTPV